MNQSEFIAVTCKLLTASYWLKNLHGFLTLSIVIAMAQIIFKQAFENSSKVTDCPITRTSRIPLVVRALIISSSAVIPRLLRRRTNGRFTFRTLTRFYITSNCTSHQQTTSAVGPRLKVMVLHFVICISALSATANDNECCREGMDYR